MRRQRETLVVVEMSPCHIFHSQTVQYYTNTIQCTLQMLYKTTIQIHEKNTIEIQQKNVTVSHIPLRGGAPGGPEEAAFIAGSGEAPEYLVSF